MSNRNLFNLKLKFDGINIYEGETKNLDELEKIVQNLKRKFK